jgi:hypothetical protein
LTVVVVVASKIETAVKGQVGEGVASISKKGLKKTTHIAMVIVIVLWTCLKGTVQGNATEVGGGKARKTKGSENCQCLHPSLFE